MDALKGERKAHQGLSAEMMGVSARQPRLFSIQVRDEAAIADLAKLPLDPSCQAPIDITDPTLFIVGYTPVV